MVVVDSGSADRTVEIARAHGADVLVHAFTSHARQFNWGYDPLNYNVPEGSFSTDPYDGAVRITECKRMIQALHAAGFKVIMDVVYNHMYSADNWFERTVPGYFMRRNEDGTLSNGSGCGDDMATEREMFRRFIVESVTYWAREYHIDGFRFDLMGLIDVTTMNAIRASLDALPGGREIIMYGEPWAAASTTTLAGTDLADKQGLRLLDPRIGHFCDRTRDAIKGHVFYSELKGYVNGDAHTNKPLIELAADAWRVPETNEGNAGQIVQYVSAHDDLTLWDKLSMSITVLHAGAGGEIGHITVDPEGFECTCGKRGCLETVSSATGVVRLARFLAEEYAGDSKLKAMLDNGEEVTSKDIFEMAQADDPFGLMVVDRVCFYLGLACGNLGNTMNPSSIVLGGGVSAAGEFLRSRVEKYFNQFTFPQVQQSTKIKLAELGNEAGVIGAASLALKFAE